MKFTSIRSTLGIFSLLFLAMPLWMNAQPFSEADSLRGSLRPERTCFDVTFYSLEVKIDPETKSIGGYNEVHFTALNDFNRIQLDLFKEMEIDRITFDETELKYERKHNAVFIDFPETLPKGTVDYITVEYHGTPRQAQMPPWDGGFVWKQDNNGKPWIGLACEGIGASLWWPMKDHLTDEPDSMAITTIVPSDLVSVSNGQLVKTKEVEEGWTAWMWKVTYPINSYNVTINVADYAHIEDTYENESGVHKLDYYVLTDNKEKAIPHFEQVKPMLKIFEEAFGEYPFWRDGYTLVETSYWGMEHQGAIAYGNKYKNNKHGWDYIIIHESGHEWWGNSVSCPDHAELWIHESFCTYSEAVYMERRYDYEKAVDYLRGHRLKIGNSSPIVGPKGVNFEGWKDSDMYYKGAWLLHTLRGVVDNDELWWKTLKSYHEDHKISIVSTDETIAYFNEKLGTDLSYIWDQYLNYKNPPVFEYEVENHGKIEIDLKMRWNAEAEGFNMPVRVITAEGGFHMVTPSQEWQTVRIRGRKEHFRVDMDRAYVFAKEMK